MKAMMALRKTASRLLIIVVCLAQILPIQPALAAPAASTQDAPAAQTQGSAMVVGEVYDAATGLPLPAASARIVVAGSPNAGAVTSTDGNGRYRLPVAPATLRLRFEKTGYVSVERVVTSVAGSWVAVQDVFLAPLDANALPLVSVVGGAGYRGGARRRDHSGSASGRAGE